MSRPKTGSREGVDFKKEWIQNLLSAKVQIFGLVRLETLDLDFWLDNIS